MKVFYSSFSPILSQPHIISSFLKKICETQKAMLRRMSELLFPIEVLVIYIVKLKKATS